MILSKDAEASLVRRPDEPGHFMRIKPLERLVIVTLDDTLLAQTVAAKRVLEVGGDLYDPVLYIPRKDVKAAFKKNDKTTHCPLKGEASYFSAKEITGTWADEIAWSYETPLDFASEIKGLIAFDTNRVAITEAPNVSS
ncbi:MAG: DUF427 domain-containing protein [Pseudomonadota bacterium]